MRACATFWCSQDGAASQAHFPVSRIKKISRQTALETCLSAEINSLFTSGAFDSIFVIRQRFTKSSTPKISIFSRRNILKDFRPVNTLSNGLTHLWPQSDGRSCRLGGARHPMQRISIYGLILVLSACNMPAPVSSTAMVTPADPVLAFVASAQLGLPGEVNAPAYGGTVTVEVQSQYFAASGSICRTYQVSGAGGASRGGLACRDGSTWQIIPPLTSGATVGSLP